MAVTFVTSTYGTSTNGSITLTYPTASMQENDLVLLAAGAVDNGDAKPIAVTGYTYLIPAATIEESADPSAAVGYKWMGATPDTGVTQTFGDVYGRIAVAGTFRGVHKAFGICAGYSTGSNGCAADPPAIGCNANGALSVVFASMGTYYDTSTINDVPSGYTLITGTRLLGPGASGVYFASVEGAYKAVNAGSIDPGAWSVTGGVADGWLAQHYILLPTSCTTIEYVGTTYGTLDIDGASSVTLTLSLTGLTGGSSSSVSENDVLVLFSTRAGVADETATITGWTSLTHVYSDDTRDTSLDVFRLTATSSPPTQAVIEYNLDGANETCCAEVRVYRNVHVTNSFAFTTASGINTAAADPPTITGTYAGSVLVFGSAAAASGATFVYNGYPPRNYQTVNGAGVYDAHLVVGQMGMGTATANLPASTAISDSTSNSWCSVCVELEPTVASVITASDTEALAAVLSIAGDLVIEAAVEVVLTTSDTEALAAALAITGDLVTECELDPGTEELAAVLSIAGDLEQICELDPGTEELAAVLSITGDTYYELAQSIETSDTEALAAVLSITGDTYYELAQSIETSDTEALAATLAITGDLAYALAFYGTCDIAATLAIAGDVAYTRAITLDPGTEELAAVLTVEGDTYYELAQSIETSDTEALAAALAITGDLEQVCELGPDAEAMAATLAITGDLIIVPIHAGWIESQPARVTRVYKADKPEDGTIELVDHPEPARPLRELDPGLGDSIMAAAFRRAKEQAEREGAKQARREAERKAHLKAQARAEREALEAARQAEEAARQAALLALRKRRDDEALVLLLLYS